jgi:hypothetical protein
MNLMSKEVNNLSTKDEGIMLYNTISVLGYCMLPVVILSFVAVVLKMTYVFINLELLLGL